VSEREITGVELEPRLSDNYSQVPNGLWTAPGLSYGSRCLLGWLHSHQATYLARLTIRRIRDEFGGGGQVNEWLSELKHAGFLTLAADGQAHRVRLLAAPWDALCGRNPTGRKPTTTGRKPTGNRAGNRPVTAPETDHIEEQVEDQVEDQDPPTPRKRGLADADETFEAWWTLYPKKAVGKGEARKRWRRMTLADRDAAVDGILRHVAHWSRVGTASKFIPAGSVWLNQRRWEDDEPRMSQGPAEKHAPGMAAIHRILAEEQAKNGSIIDTTGRDVGPLELRTQT
jgi:hypothetical protein